MVKLVYLVLDGAADDPSASETPLMAADTPGLDELARNARMGLHYSIALGVAPESDAAVLSLLGYDPEKHYTGRGPLEALGAGIRIRENYEVAFRANFATVDESTLELVDRRVGRSLTSEEAKLLAEAVDGIELDGGRGYARVRATIGHRAVVVLGHREHRLSGEVDNTDPAYVRKGKISEAVPNPPRRVREARPLEETEEARLAARLANEFTWKAHEVLKNHPVNLERARRGLLKANIILLRDAGSQPPKLKPLHQVFSARFAAITEMPVEKGIAIAAGMYPAEALLAGSKEERLTDRLRLTLKLLESYDAVYVHLKGPDEPGHDGDFEGKVREIELIDRHYVQPLLDRVDLDQVAFLVTSDHATPWRLRAHSGDPIPFMVSWRGLAPDGLQGFNEKAAAKGSLGVLSHGWQLLPLTFSLIRSGSQS